MDKGKKIIILVIIVVLIIAIAIIIGNKNKNKNTNTNSNSNSLNSIANEEISQSANDEQKNEIVEEFVEIVENDIKLNNSEKLSETKTFQGLTIKDIQLTNGNGKTELIANIENKTEKDTQAMLIDVVLYDKEGNTITTLGGRISPIKAGQTLQFSTSSMIDYANAYDFEFKLK